MSSCTPTHLDLGFPVNPILDLALKDRPCLSQFFLRVSSAGSIVTPPRWEVEEVEMVGRYLADFASLELVATTLNN